MKVTRIYLSIRSRVQNAHMSSVSAFTIPSFHYQTRCTVHARAFRRGFAGSKFIIRRAASHMHVWALEIAQCTVYMSCTQEGGAHTHTHPGSRLPAKPRRAERVMPTTSV